jgi:MoxR-like ATPase
MDYDIRALSREMISKSKKIIVGKTEQITLMFTPFYRTAIFCSRTCPASARQRLSKHSACSGLRFQAIQFTPDLLPSDVVGMNIYNQKKCEFELMRGPVMTNILLADEINRADPPTQSALLEIHGERQVTIDGATYRLCAPFSCWPRRIRGIRSTFHCPPRRWTGS